MPSSKEPTADDLGLETSTDYDKENVNVKTNLRITSASPLNLSFKMEPKPCVFKADSTWLSPIMSIRVNIFDNR